MKVLHVVEPFSSGIITFVISLTKALPEFEHTVLHGVRTTEDNIESVRARFSQSVKFKVWKYANRTTNPLRDFLALIQLIRHLRASEYDVVHLHSAKAGFLGRVAGWILSESKIIYTPNGAPFLRKDINTLQRMIFTLLEQLGDKLSGCIVCCGKSESILYTRLGMKNRFVNNGVIINELESREINWPIIIGCMAILTYQKNPLSFNNIAKHFKGDQRVRFVWIGGGELGPYMDEEAVHITGWLEESETARSLRNVDIYMSTALWEGQPFAVLEAMEAGKCLLLSSCEGNVDLVVDGKNGFLFKNEDEAIGKIKKLLDKKELIMQMGVESRTHCINNHSLENVRREYAGIYKEIGG